MAYPATFEIQRPTKEFDKAQVFLRILIVLVISFFGVSGIVFGGAYIVLPILAAILISQKGAQEYLASAVAGPVRWLQYLLGFYSYIALARDDIPMDSPDSVLFRVQPTGTPTVGSALLRLILAIPHAFVLAILGIVFFFVWIIAAISILINGTYPDWAFGFIQGYLRWQARLFAYLASLVDEYPPFSFENGGTQPAATTPPPPATGGPTT
jgi:hypothetical protein